MRWLAIALIFIPGIASAQEAFQTPSGNIHCGMIEEWIRCDIRQAGFVPPPRPGDCDLEYGQVVGLWPKGGARLICHGDSIAESGFPVLGYGQAWQGGGMTCNSAQTGLRCSNAAGRGFEMSRAQLRLF